MKLHLGCGDDIRPGWLNIDIADRREADYLKFDLSLGKLPQIPAVLDKQVTEIYSCHFFEHLDYFSAYNLMKECCNAITSDGRFRICLPDFRRLAQAYVHGDLEYFRPLHWVSPKNLMGYVNYSLYQTGEHKCMWDFDSLMATLREVGFVSVFHSEFHPSLDNPDPIRPQFSFYADAYKTIRPL